MVLYTCDGLYHNTRISYVLPEHFLGIECSLDTCTTKDTFSEVRFVSHLSGHNMYACMYIRI